MGQTTPAFKVLCAVIAVSLVGYGAYRLRSVLAPSAKTQTATTIPAEDANAAVAVTTVKEYSFKPQERLPEVKGIAAYKPLTNNTIKFALNVWAGWAPIILANDGFSPNKVWKTASGEEFRVELVLIDNPVAMRDAYASGDVHIGWGTVDMIPLLIQGFVDSHGKSKDPRVMPRIFQQIDFSNGGDGMVGRSYIKSVADLRGKKVVMAQNSPSQFFALTMMVQAGIQPSEVETVYTDDAFQAAAAFNADKSIAACVSWAPDIYNLSEAKGNRLVVTTAQVNKLSDMKDIPNITDLENPEVSQKRKVRVRQL